MFRFLLYLQHCTISLVRSNYEGNSCSPWQVKSMIEPQLKVMYKKVNEYTNMMVLVLWVICNLELHNLHIGNKETS